MRELADEFSVYEEKFYACEHAGPLGSIAKDDLVVSSDIRRRLGDEHDSLKKIGRKGTLFHGKRI